MTIALLLAAAMLHPQAAIEERVSLVEDVAPKEAVVFVNLNNTLYTAPNTLTLKQWLGDFKRAVKKEIPNAKEQKAFIDKEILNIVEGQKKVLIEEGTPEWITKLKQENTALGYSQKAKEKYGTNYWEVTDRQIKALEIDFTDPKLPQNALKEKGIYELYNGVLYENGELNNTHDESAIINFIKNSNWSLKPKKVVVIDNHPEILERIERAAKKAGIAFEGIWFQGKNRVSARPYDRDLGTIQWKAFLSDGIYLSDEEAEARKEAIIDQKSLTTQEEVESYFDNELIELIRSQHSKAS